MVDSKRPPVNLLVADLPSNRSREHAARRAGQPIQHAGVARCLQLLRRNLQIKLRDMEKASGMSRRGLHKAFMTHLGYPPGAILRTARVHRACELLAGSNLSLDEIAARCGYRNANSLWVAFRRDLGISPQRFREQQVPPDGEDPELQ